ncbi:MAG: RNA polymerase-binding protein DksA [Deltaproteobacteria bacterium]|nr:MAG: RNA polymerase-binding protein DksA [Deltaproteobacteria bacterium]
MNKKDLKHFKDILTKRREEAVKSVEATREIGMGITSDDLPDEVDLATSESDQSMSLRLKDRERILLNKIDAALAKIEDASYGICESCGEEIGIKRLEARPVTDLCIRCKEEQEKMEKTYAE